jgi:hypothetical protein
MKNSPYLPDPETKDFQRVEKMIAKSETGDGVDVHALLRQCLTMAAKITDREKALRRAAAFYFVEGIDRKKAERAAQVFIERANRL